ncbi:MAG: UDP-galactose-lipid carrier transferase [Chthoniobacterales bacterium]|nr:UDP-galactose-lipid carrier transferase [Chthoniobacterales bacterium]
MPVASAEKPIRLADLDQTKSQTPERYRDKMREGHLRLLQLQHALKDAKRSVVVVVEGPDAAGKGGAIKRLVERLDPRHLRVYSTIKPTAEQYARHYLWRFWTKLPPRSEIAIFDRSWYGRVLVERIEGFATEDEWKRGYREINEFERTLHEDGMIIIKFWLHITKQEQMKRFKKRQEDPMKRWKMNDEDWRNRRKWNSYIQAAEDMFDKTSPKFAPWHVIPANFKWYTRVKVLQTVCDRLSAELE